MRSNAIKGEKNSLAIVKLGISFLLAAFSLYLLANELVGFVFADDRLTPVQAEALVGCSKKNLRMLIWIKPDGTMMATFFTSIVTIHFLRMV